MTQPPYPEKPAQPQPDPIASPPTDPSGDTPAGHAEPRPETASRAPRRRVRPDFTPFVTYTLLAITVAVFIGQNISEALLGQDWLILLGLKENTAIAQGQWWRLFTPMLLHASVIHITFNMYALYILGGELERYFGRGRFLALYLLSGFAGNVLSFMFTINPSLGASTAVFGLLGAQGVFIYKNRGLLGTGYRRALNQVIGIAALNLFFGFAEFIDNWGHIGGLVGGSLFTWLGGPVFQVSRDKTTYSVADERNSSDVVRAGIWVGLLFFFLAMVTILFRLN